MEPQYRAEGLETDKNSTSAQPFTRCVTLSELLQLCAEISPGCSLEGLMLKLKLQHFGHLM